MENTEVALNPDEQAVLMKLASDIQFGIGTISAALKGQMPLTKDSLGMALRLIEGKLSDLGNGLGIETDSAVKIEERHVKLRTANLRIRQLEAQVGSEQTAEGTRMGIQALTNRINEWWGMEGFGLVSGEPSFGQYRCEVTLSCSLFGNFAILDSKTPVSDKELKALWRKSLVDRGFSLSSAGRSRSLIDCDQNRKVLCDFIKGRLPSATITSIENTCDQDHGFIIRDVKVSIRNYDEILRLPVTNVSIVDSL